jgi:uncharacterized protein (TIGR02001 family)
MRKTLFASAALTIAGPLFVPVAVLAAEAAPAAPLSFSVGLVSDYLARGISQTHANPAVQGSIDYAHPSGFYLGAWGSNISWVKDWLGKGSVEVDVYGGFKQTVGDWGYDVGYTTYNYPGHGPASPGNLANPNTQEVYIGGSYRWLSAKYYYATSRHFIGWYGGQNLDQNTRGSDYIELNANYGLGGGWTLTGHAGHQRIRKLSIASYSDWKIGVTKDVGFGVVGLAWWDTNAKGNCSPAEIYCWGTGGTGSAAPGGNFKNVAMGTAILSFTKTF